MTALSSSLARLDGAVSLSLSYQWLIIAQIYWLRPQIHPHGHKSVSLFPIWRPWYWIPKLSVISSLICRGAATCIPGLFALPDFFVQKKTFGCFKRALSVINLHVLFYMEWSFACCMVVPCFLENESWAAWWKQIQDLLNKKRRNWEHINLGFQLRIQEGNQGQEIAASTLVSRTLWIIEWNLCSQHPGQPVLCSQSCDDYCGGDVDHNTHPHHGESWDNGITICCLDHGPELEIWTHISVRFF